MAKFKLEKIMKKYDFNKENESDKDLLCILCKKILINAHISPCECRFCFDCILNYLNEETKPCPGNKDECKTDLIILNENIVVDHVTNNKISKLIVKCPKKNCEFKDELKNIENHIQVCNYQSFYCPYLNIGCNLSNIRTGNVNDHLQLEIESHTKLLIDYIDNLNNEVGRLKTIVDKLVDENKMLKCEISEIKLDGERKQRKYDEQNREIILLNEDMVELRNVDKYMRDDVDELKLDVKNKQSKIFEIHTELKEKIESSHEKLEKIESNMQKKEKSIKYDNENDIKKLKLNAEEKDNVFEELQSKYDEQTHQIQLLNEEIGPLINIDKSMRTDGDKLNLGEERIGKLFGALENKFVRQSKQIDQFNNRCQLIESKFEKQNKQILHFENRCQQKENKCEQQNKQILQFSNKCQQILQFSNKCQQIENKFTDVKEKMENKEKDLLRNIDETKSKQTELMTMSNKIDKTIKNFENKLLEIEINRNKLNSEEFIWRIDNITAKIKDAKNGINLKIYSESFYTHKNGYKMYLYVCPNGFGGGKGTHLSVSFQLIEGEFDDILEWPFKYSITLALINQKTRLIHVSKTIKYDDMPNNKAWHKPITQRNVGTGCYNFIELNELLINENLLFNNQIFIKCSVTL